MKKIILVAFVLWLGISATSAEAGTSSVVATVNIYNARIESQNENTFNISFDLSNREGVQSGIKYSTVLTKLPSNEIVDEQVYDETLSLSENETVSKNITYTPSTSLSSGVYTLWIQSKNDRGFSFAMADLGNVTLTSSKSPKVEILSDTCYLTIDNKKPVEKYSLIQGLSINYADVLVATCKVSSTFPATTHYVPTFETYFRSTFGDKANQTSDPTNLLAIPKGVSSISVVIPKATQPQSYETKFYLTDSNGLNKSNAVNINYVLKGISGTIQNAVFDKDAYIKGDTARLQIFATFPEGNQKLDVVITDQKGDECGSFTKQDLKNDEPVVDVSVEIEKDCENPIAQVTLSGILDGNSGFQTLDSREFQTSLDSESATVAKPGVIILIVAGILLILAVLFFSYRNKRIIKISVLFLFFIGISIFGDVREAKADTVTYTPDPDVGTFIFTLSTNKSIYDVGERVRVTGSVTFLLAPSRSSFEGIAVSPYITATIDNVPPARKFWQDPYDIHFIRTFGSASLTFNRALSIGNHHAVSNNFGSVFFDSSLSYGTISVPFEVSALVPPVVTIQATPATVELPANDSTLLEWSATNDPTECTASGDWSGDKDVSGSQTISGLTVGEYTYTLVCSNASGSSAPSSANVTVINPLLDDMSGVLLANPVHCDVLEGQRSCYTDLAWNVTNPEIVGGSTVTSNTDNDGNVSHNFSIIPPVSSGTTDSGTKSNVAVSHTGRTFFLYNNGHEFPPITVTASCAPGADWNAGTKTCKVGGNGNGNGNCTDGIRNGDETGVDIGGRCGGGIGNGNCTDGIRNGDETGVDIGGRCGGGIDARGVCSDDHSLPCSSGRPSEILSSPSLWTWTCSGTDTSELCTEPKSPIFIED
ncbi:MAG: DUF2304 domain-containing protein [Candidatus Paceibacterota bacterium]|jgi:hypothetical protein